MRILLGILMAATALAQEPEEASLRCVKDLTVPRYPEIARQARVQGTVAVRFRITEAGRSEQVTDNAAVKTASMAVLLGDTVKRAVQASAFDRICAGQWLTLVFKFELGSQADGAHTKFQGPSTFVIVAEEQVINF